MECHAGVEFDVQQVVLFPDVCKGLEDAFFVSGGVGGIYGGSLTDDGQEEQYDDIKRDDWFHV